MTLQKYEKYFSIYFMEKGNLEDTFNIESGLSRHFSRTEVVEPN